MPDRLRHRGKHPKDNELFAQKQLSVLKQAVDDYSMLLSRNYSSNAALKLVGDHFLLNTRQRKAVERVSVPGSLVTSRYAKSITTSALRKKTICIDGYNQLITVESLLSGAFVFKCRDGSYRDIASIHGTYRKVEETIPAIKLIGRSLRDLDTGPVNWLLDSPISNSGRLKTMLTEIAEEHGWEWQVELNKNPDRILAEVPGPVITSDSWILDQCRSWFNLTGYIIKQTPSKSDNVINTFGPNSPTGRSSL